MRLGSKLVLFSDRPFAGDGYNLYVNTGSTVQYRNHRLMRGCSLGPQPAGKGAHAGTITPGGTYNLPAGFAGQDLVFDVRRFKDDVENETDNYKTAKVTLDGNSDGVSEILGAGSVISQEIIAGGVVKIRFRYFPDPAGIQPDLFRLTRTAGPSLPADITLSVTVLTPAVLEFTTGVLNDASAYTFTIRAENGAVTKDLVTGLSVTADATGPAAPISGSAQAW